ncbi:unnamed protein product [Eruca vesicaria subsp. sativa]|uniref:F-box domain-containing protein n=1 Tax=Eruca vesicaria subsp. sativa TaxID=29727 RepID=A0ABC8LWI9_ERUVS|nr:unnamed protein product [Eruca vesicaria subsp. sativa]
MTSKINGENEQSSQPQQSLFTSLPEDVVVDILARVPRCDYPTLSLVSKQFHSLVTSHEIYVRRSLLRCTEKCLYVVILNVNESPNDGLYILRRKANGNHRLVYISSLSNWPIAESFLVVGSMIYGFGGMDWEISSRAFSIDCRSHTMQPLPDMPIPMADTCAGFLDGKIYVFGHCSMISEVIVVFNTKTQVWEPRVIKANTSSPAEAWHFGQMVVMDDKIYTRYLLNGFVYVPKENKWEKDEVLNSKTWEDGGACVLDEVMYYYDSFGKCLNRYDPKERRWGVVKGLDDLVAEIGFPYWTNTLRYGRNLALYFRKREGEEPRPSSIQKIWCAEISLGRRQGNDIWGEVEWCDQLHEDQKGQYYHWEEKVFVTLSSKEKKEDFMAMKGCKPSHRPKKRAKLVQSSLLLVSPGTWLADMCPDRYDVGVKKSSKKV